MALRLRGIGTTTGDEFVGERVIDAGQVLRIGRAHENDWVVADPTCQVSKRHCAISHQAGRFVLSDLSTNGVFVDDEALPVGRDAMRPLTNGQKLQIGIYRFAVDIDAADAIPAAAPSSAQRAKRQGTPRPTGSRTCRPAVLPKPARRGR
jgi:predicted component of type VI protein secretion system